MYKMLLGVISGNPSIVQIYIYQILQKHKNKTWGNINIHLHYKGDCM